ncbi:2'-5' RNA ligase family protein [Agrobacterium cavarae]|uniref:2'-5' RNA ligase family protein n=1 Tax=Agrobacterium cavarae TaxID=2528239 RepID=UPI003FD0F60B
MKTRQPLVLTARIAEGDIEAFDRLRQRHFPPDRNVLGAHLTMFHRLPSEYRDTIVETLKSVAAQAETMAAAVNGLRHLGAGVAFLITCPALEDIRARLNTEFVARRGSQDMQTWRLHITIQNNPPRATADALYRDLNASFEPHTIEIDGLDLWNYLGGPWERVAFASFEAGSHDAGQEVAAPTKP